MRRDVAYVYEGYFTSSFGKQRPSPYMLKRNSNWNVYWLSWKVFCREHKPINRC